MFLVLLLTQSLTLVELALASCEGDLTQFPLLIHSLEPQPSALVILRELADIHGHARFIVNQRQ